MKIKIVVVGILNTNCYLLYNEKEAIVVDPGGDGEKIMKELESLNLSVKHIINTHSHLDHTAANSYLKRKTGADVLENLKEGDVVEMEEHTLKVLEVPGHTKDSICLMGDDFLIAGDVLFEDGYGRTDLPGGSGEEMKKTLERLRKLVPGDFVIYPGHGDSFLMREWKKPH